MTIIPITTILFCIMTDPVFPDFHNKTLDEIENNKDWEIMSEAKGDLNGDSKQDMAIILQSKDSVLEKRCADCEEKNHKLRIVLVLMNKNNTLKVVAQNNVFIARADEGGMTQEMKPEISIADKQLTVSYLLIRGDISYTFEDKKGEIVLVRASKLSTSHYIFKSEVVDFKKRILLTESRSDNDEPVQKKITRLTVEKFKRLEDLKMMGDWDVGGVFL